MLGLLQAFRPACVRLCDHLNWNIGELNNNMITFPISSNTTCIIVRHDSEWTPYAMVKINVWATIGLINSLIANTTSERDALEAN